MALFGGLFVLPLCVALSLCTMPCCHPDSGPAVASGAMDCATECAIQADDATPTAVVTVPSVPHAALIVATVVAVHAPDAVPPEGGAGPPPRRASASLNILNSIFRI